MFQQPIQFLDDQAAMGREWQPDESLAYTRWLSTNHYENFHVVSFLLPKRLHQDFFNVYAYCRWSDDLGDETGSAARSIELLEWWRTQLRALYSGQRPSHPVFVALRETIDRHALPAEPFDHLLDAFVQDQTKTRYQDWSEVLAYCEKSANPVGRLVLMLCGYRDRERFARSDDTCTALQLANFWQDVTVDLLKDRVYLPLELFERHGYTLAELYRREATPAFRAVMKDSVDYADQLFRRGLPLVKMLDRRLALDIDLFSRGGMKVLEKIRRQDYNVLARRPAISKTERVRLLVGSLIRLSFAA